MAKRFDRHNLSLLVIVIAFLTIVGYLKFYKPQGGAPIPTVTPSASPTSSSLALPSSSTPTPTPSTPTTSVTGPAITTPSSNSKVTSPLIITGIVPAGWMFEGSFPIKLIDKQKNTVVSGIAQEKTPGSWQSGQPIEFTARLEFTTSEKSGFIVLEKDNPSGLPENDESYQIPIKFGN